MLLIISGLLFVGIELHKTVTVVIDGTATTVPTWSQTTGSLLESLRIPVNPSDRIDPAIDTRLQEGETIYINRAYPAVILADGDMVTVVSAERLAGNLLQEAGIQLYPGDILQVDGLDYSASGSLSGSKQHSLLVRRVIPITLNTPDGSQQLYSTARTLGHALQEAGISLSEADDLEPAASTLLDGPLTAWYKPARTIIIQANGETIHRKSAAATVGDALEEVGLSLQGLDYSLPGEAAPLPKNGKIQVVRVQEAVQLTQEPIQFETEYLASADLEIDTQSILQTGTYGVLAQRVRIRSENGQETSRAIEAEWLAQEPKNRIVGYGTGITKKTLKVPGGEIEYWRAVPMYATSYSPCRLGVAQCNDVTALGIKLQKGVAGVAKSWYGFTAGQRVYVPGYGTAIIADFGNGLPGKNLIDLGFSESDFEPWHQNVIVYFLWPPPPPEQIRYILP